MRFTDLLNDNPQLVLLAVENGKYVEKPLKVNSRSYTKNGTLTKIYLKINEEEIKL